MPHLPHYFYFIFFLKKRQDLITHTTETGHKFPNLLCIQSGLQLEVFLPVLPKCYTAVCSAMPSSGSVPPPLSFIPTSVWLYLSIYLFIGWRGIRYTSQLFGKRRRHDLPLNVKGALKRCLQLSLGQKSQRDYTALWQQPLRHWQ